MLLRVNSKLMLLQPHYIDWHEYYYKFIPSKYDHNLKWDPLSMSVV